MSLALAFGMTALVSCEQEQPNGEGPVGTADITGTVTDTDGAPVSGVSVSTSASEDITAVTSSDGTYKLADVPQTTQMVKFEKEGYGTAAVTIPASKFVDGTAKANVIMEFAQAVIRGKVLDAMNNNAPVEGATVTLNGAKTTTTAADGTYVFEGLTLQNYTLVISKSGVGQATVNLTKDMFNAEGVIVVEDVALSLEILRGLSLTDLKNCQPWYGNEFRGGKGNGGGVVDWSTVFMSAAFSCYGDIEYQNEGFTARIVNNDEGKKNPADPDMFDSYFYGRKLITEDNYLMTVYCRTHQAPVIFGVQVVDLSASEPVAKKVGENQTHPSGDNTEYVFDLSEYVGKEVVIAIGQYRMATGDYWHQFVIRKVSFAKEKNLGDGYLPGTEVAGLEGWHMTEEMVRSTMSQELKSFSGLPTTGSDMNLEPRGGLGYRRWNGSNHILANWNLMFVSKDMEPAVSEGFVIKTTHGAKANYDLPESYFYAKFDIEAGANTMDLICRNFDANKMTTFKVVAITEDSVAAPVEPSANTAANASAVENGSGCWQFIHENGGPGAPENYAKFTYDLSAYNGKSVVICIGVYKGVTENQDGEQKLCVYGVEIR